MVTCFQALTAHVRSPFWMCFQPSEMMTEAIQSSDILFCSFLDKFFLFVAEKQLQCNRALIQERSSYIAPKVTDPHPAPKKKSIKRVS